MAGSEDIGYNLHLTPAELKITHTALRSMLDGFGHEAHEREVGAVVRGVLSKLPDDAAIHAIDLSAELGLPRRVA